MKCWMGGWYLGIAGWPAECVDDLLNGWMILRGGWMTFSMGGWYFWMVGWPLNGRMILRDGWMTFSMGGWSSAWVDATLGWLDDLLNGWITLSMGGWCFGMAGWPAEWLIRSLPVNEYCWCLLACFKAIENAQPNGTYMYSMWFLFLQERRIMVHGWLKDHAMLNGLQDIVTWQWHVR